jgi:transcriptional antiterminator RfaH
MVLLTEEESVCPDLLQDAHDSAASPNFWCVVRTKPRLEKAAARVLRALGIPFFLPTALKRVRHGGREITTAFPVFAGRLFAHLKEDELQLVSSAACVAEVVVVQDGPALRRELKHVHSLLSLNGAVTRELNGISRGPRMRVQSGPLAGIEGVVAQRQERSYLVVGVESIGRAFWVPIDRGSQDLSACA